MARSKYYGKCLVQHCCSPARKYWFNYCILKPAAASRLFFLVLLKWLTCPGNKLQSQQPQVRIN